MSFPDIWAAALPYLFAALVGGYLIGGIPFGVVLSRLMGHGDLRQIGSGNIGATNALRTGDKKLALLVLLFDAAKGLVPAILAERVVGFGPDGAAAAGLGAFLGHCYSPYLGFKGGKGVATGFGALLAWRWEIALICAGVWLALALLFRIASAAALATCVAAVVLFPLFEEWTFVWAAALMALIIIWRHRANIGRLVRGEEPTISLGSKRVTADADHGGG